MLFNASCRLDFNHHRIKNTAAFYIKHTTTSFRFIRNILAYQKHKINANSRFLSPDSLLYSLCKGLLYLVRQIKKVAANM